jgi:hypothetical protein
MNLARSQAVTGVTAPQIAEAMIREAWPSVAAYPAVASLGRVCIRSIVAAPVGWAIMLPFYFLKILPFIATRYTLTNRRLMIRRGLKPQPAHELALADIDRVNLVKDANSDFYRSATLEAVLVDGKVGLRLPGVPEPEGFRHAIVNARQAWAPAKKSTVSASLVPA